MQIEKKYWLPGYLNGDDADFRVEPDQYINMQDFRVGDTSDNGYSQQAESVGGTALIVNSNIPTLGVNTIIGVALDFPNRRAVYFMHNSLGTHGIYCYDFITHQTLLLLSDGQVTGGLNFAKNHLIHSARVENRNVYWTDNLNEPRRLDIDAAIRMNTGILPPVLSNSPNILASLSGTPTLILGIYFFTYTLPSVGFQYGPLIFAQIVRVGNGVTTGAPTVIQIPMDWTNYPTISYNQVMLNGFNAYFHALDPTDTQWHTALVAGTITVTISFGWDMGTGDATFAPVVAMTLQLYSKTTIYSIAPYVYTSPLDRSVISWIRRQPGLPPTQAKIVQTSPLLVNNFIQNEAFQFCYRYQYRDFELSTLSALSTVANYNTLGNLFLLTASAAVPYNRIDVSIPFAEVINQDVLRVDLVARYINSGVYFIIKTWDKNILADAQAIARHNAGTQALLYSFYNDKGGIALDAAYSVKPFDSMPVLTQTIEMAKGRAFMANNLLGYSPPSSSSLVISIDPLSPGTTLTGEWFFISWDVYVPAIGGGSSTIVHLSGYFLYVTGLQDAAKDGYYSVNTAFTPVPAPPNTGSVAYSNLVFRGGDAYNVTLTDFNGNPGITFVGVTYTITSVIDQNKSSLVTGAPTSQTGPTIVFKTAADYQGAITFYDFAGRKCGVFTNDSLKFNTPDGSYNVGALVGQVNWTLSNANALSEIPIWAYYYSIDLTKCLRTRFFVQARAKDIKYATKDIDGNYTFTSTAWNPFDAGLAIDISYLSSQQMGYIFTEGDIIKIYVQGNPTVYQLRIVAQVGNWVVTELQNINLITPITLVPVKVFFEIYTPYQRISTEPYFEGGNFFPVQNAGTSTRIYSAVAGHINGDTYIMPRDTGDGLTFYYTEAMSPNDKFWKMWNTDAGRPNFIDFIGQVQRTTSVSFSNTFISGSQNNGLSTFDALDSTDIGPDFGAIMKLQLCSKVSKIGDVMLAICAGQSTASLYLSENTLISNTGDSVVAQANSVIGSVHELKGEFGTLNPESVVELRGNVYWFDVQNGKIIQYADNGLFPISGYKLSRYWKLFSDQYKSLTPAQIEALGGRPFVFGTADPHHGELLFTVPNTLAAPPRGFLLDHPSQPYPFDVWDGVGKTLVYKLYAAPNRWAGSYSFVPEFSFYLENNLYSFKAGQLYLHNQTNYCNYYGVQYQPKIMCLSNQQINKPKSYNNLSSESNKAPILVYLMSLYPYLQASDLVLDDFVNKEGIFYATIYRNKLDPAFDNNYPAALIAGEKMRTTALYIMGQWDATAGIVQVKFLNIGYTLSLGQKV